MASLSPEDVDARLSDLPGWERVGETIQRRFEFEDFAESIAFVNRIALVAEELSHHPDLAVSWNVVTVSITTHSQGALTNADFELAGRVDALS